VTYVIITIGNMQNLNNITYKAHYCLFG